jgi:group I intron endonuclease
MGHIDTTKSGIYMILNVVNQARYVGSAARCLRHRHYEHWYLLRNNKHRTPHLQAAWNKYGESAFAFVPLQNCAPEECLTLEQQWLDRFKESGIAVYNARLVAASQLGMKHTDEARRRMSIALTGKKKTISPEGMARIIAAVRSFDRKGMNAQKFTLVSPTGETINGKNLLQFAVDNHLDFSAIAKVVRGERPSHKGYTAPKSRAAYLAKHPLTRPANLAKKCLECGGEFHIKPSETKRRRFCSRECRAAHDKRIYAGAGNPNFRHGGRVAGVKRVRHHR